MKSRITIKDIANLASVSETTVSRYLNKKYEYMSETTKRKIEKAIETTHYRPNNVARSLKSNQSNTIGAVIADIENPFSNLIIEGLTNRADELNYTLMISITNNDVDKEIKAINSFLDNQVDGLIIQAVSSESKHLTRLSQVVPVVLIDRDVEGLETDIVTTNNYEVGKHLVSHLIEAGFKSISFISEPTINNTVRKSRHQAFIDTVRVEKDIFYSDIIVNRNDCKNISIQLDQFMTLPMPRVLVAGNGLIQMTVLEYMKNRNYIINKDYYLSGFDNYTWSSMIGDKGITAVDQETFKLGAEAVSLLYNRISNIRSPKDRVVKILKNQLIIRDTEIIN